RAGVRRHHGPSHPSPPEQATRGPGMKHPSLLIALAAAAWLATGPAGAQSTSTPPKRAAAPTSAAAPAPSAETPPGDTHVHRFFQAWGRGMDKADKAVSKVMPKPDHRWPGTATGTEPAD